MQLTAEYFILVSLGSPSILQTCRKVLVVVGPQIWCVCVCVCKGISNMTLVFSWSLVRYGERPKGLTGA